MSAFFLPELLVPAGDMEKLETGLFYGADAVYLGGKNFSLRAQAGGFDREELCLAIDLAHTKKVRVYYTLNILAWEKHIQAVREELEFLASQDIDGLIIADPGIILLAREIAPHIPIHLSTQANTSNSQSVRFWQEQGIMRINLARELGRTALEQVRTAVSDMELEVFVHGAMCMAISGRCLMSFHLNDRLANHGLCTHPCRFDYRRTAFRVEERQRGEEVWEVFQDEEFSHIFSAEDLCLLPFLNFFGENKINALKIEGRMKSSSYLAPVVDVYRSALDTLAGGQIFSLPDFLAELKKTTTRPLGSGFFLSQREVFVQPSSARPQIVARILDQVGTSAWRISVKSPWNQESPVELLLPGMERPCLKPGEYGLEDGKGQSVNLVHPGTEAVLRCEYPGLSPWLFLRRA